MPTPPRLFTITWPLLIELLLGMAVGIVGTVLAARLSENTGAAFAMAHHVLGTLFIVFRVIGAGVGVVVAQNLGAGQPARAQTVARAVLGAATWIGLLATLAAATGRQPLLTLLNAPPEIRPLAAPFLLVLAPALLLDAWNTSLFAVLRAHLRARETLAVTVLMHATHLALLAPLMLGLNPLPGQLPLPALGLAGYGVALLSARVLALLLLLWLWRTQLQLRPRWADLWQLRRVELAEVARLGVPGAAENAAYRLAFVASIAAVGTLGAAAIATHAYVQQVMMVVLLFGLATGLSVEVLVGHLVGAGHLRAAHALVGRALRRGLLVSLAVASAAAMAGPTLMRLFTADPDIISTASALLWCTVLLEPGRTFNLVVINALRATGDARYPVVVGAVSMAVVLAGGSWLLGVHLGLGLVGVWLAYAADEWLRGLLMWRRWQRLHWIPYARASRRRLAAANAAATIPAGAGA
jgi:putative MATE family efflux protein